MNALRLLLVAAALGLAPQVAAVPGLDAGHTVAPQDLEVEEATTPATCQADPCDGPTTTPAVPISYPGMPIEQVCLPADTLCLVEAGPFPGIPAIDEEVEGRTVPALCAVPGVEQACIGPVTVGPVFLGTTPAVDAGVHTDAFDPTVDANLDEREAVGPVTYTVPEDVPVLGGGPITVCPEEAGCERRVTPEAGAHTTVEVVLVIDGTDHGTSQDVGADVPSV